MFSCRSIPASTSVSITQFVKEIAQIVVNLTECDRIDGDGIEIGIDIDRDKKEELVDILKMYPECITDRVRIVEGTP